MTEQAKKRSILVVDDEPFVLKVLVRQLMQLRFDEVISCEHAQDALAILRKGTHALTSSSPTCRCQRWMGWSLSGN